MKFDEPHRIDLAQPGYALERFAVVPDKDGQRFLRTLTPIERR